MLAERNLFSVVVTLVFSPASRRTSPLPAREAFLDIFQGIQIPKLVILFVHRSLNKHLNMVVSPLTDNSVSISS